MDAGFNWLGTDNDQSQGDRLMMPFFGAHFGWGHPYSSHWSGDHNLPTAQSAAQCFQDRARASSITITISFRTSFGKSFSSKNGWMVRSSIDRLGMERSCSLSKARWNRLLNAVASAGSIGQEKDNATDVQSWALAFVMNPTPPTKMPNTTARVELEQSIPAKQLIERADKAVDRPALRHMYLTLMSRATFRGKDLQQIAAFYEMLRADEERSLVLPALTTSIDSRELVWNAFGGEPSLQRAGVERRKLNQSIMPDGYQLFGNEQVADLTAFLLTLKHNAQGGADTQRH